MRFAAARTATELWRVLTTGQDCIVDPPPDRPGLLQPGGYLERVDTFDCHFFEISPREAACMDPQQRLLLEVAWEALEDAGQGLATVRKERVGVFVGLAASDYRDLLVQAGVEQDVTLAVGLSRNAAAGRISRILGLDGPSLVVDTDRSSSLAAVHLACRSLWAGDCTLALAGGASLILDPQAERAFSRAQMLAPDGRCRFADARAQGFGRGEGVGLVVLKTLQRARADGDPIYAVVLGGAINHCGLSADDFLAPSQSAQEKLLRAAWTDAGVAPEEIQYIEAHGTGTPVGDPIEIRAIGAALGPSRGSACAIGSVKTNLGHAEAAAGIAGLIKVALSLDHAAIPPSLHFRDPNPQIPFADLPVIIQQRLTPWPSDKRAVAGVSSFGLTGTNAHLVLASARDLPSARAAAGEDRSAPVAAGTQARSLLLPLSARGAPALRQLAERWLEWLQSDQPPPAPLDLCYTASTRRTHHSHRLAVVGRSVEELRSRLAAYLDDESAAGVASGVVGRSRPQVVFVFSGQGSQWLGMGRQLYDEEAVFRKTMEDCDRAHRAFAQWSLLDELKAGPAASRLRESDVLQPTLVAVQISLAALWQSWGLKPTALAGASLGEISAAHLSGALSLAEAMEVVGQRSSLMRRARRLEPSVALIELGAEQVGELLEATKDRVFIIGINSPNSTTVAGEPDAVRSVLDRVEALGAFGRAVRMDVPSHTPAMDPLVPELVGALGHLQPRPGTIPIYSTVTGDKIAGELMDAGYWGRNLREPVRLAAATARLLADGHDLLVEVSPHPISLSPLLDSIHQAGARAAAIGSTRRDEDERESMLRSLGACWAAGADVDWAGVQPGGQCVRLPTYPWQQERCWYELAEAGAATSTPPRTPPASLAQTSPAAPSMVERLADALPDDRRSLLTDYVLQQLRKVLGLSPAGVIDLRTPFRELGLSSLMAVELRTRLGAALGSSFPATLLFSYPTVEKVVEHLVSRVPEPPRESSRATQTDPATAKPVPVRGNRESNPGYAPVAVVGMACRFPGGADGPEAFWHLLSEGRSGIREVPPDRWSSAETYDPNPDAAGKMITRWGGFLDAVDAFDAAFFGITPHESESMDPQHRLLLEVAWHALEDAGLPFRELAGSRTGVYLGIMTNDYASVRRSVVDQIPLGPHDATGCSASIAAGRLSYFLGLQGPAVSIDTACSSSLVAVHLACQAIRSGECPAALVGGVSLMLWPDPMVAYSKARMMAPDGLCKTFDAAANGYVRGEGCGVLVLKRLSDALADRDRVLAVIRGSAVNQDGRSSGLTAPNGSAQIALIREALDRAGVRPLEVSYVEAHGTGTPLGDPIEVQSLGAALAADRPPSHALALGSVKTNLGHLEAAAGVAGVIKVVLALEHEEIPPHLNLHRLNQHLGIEGLSIVIPTARTPWRAGERIAGVSSFGFSGTNAHVLLAEAPPQAASPQLCDRPLHVLAISARDESALVELVRRFEQRLGESSDRWPDICFTANTGRTHFSSRLAVAADSADRAREQLSTIARTGATPTGVRRGQLGPDTEPTKIAFLYTGQGAQYFGMGRSLFEAQPSFRRTLERCSDLLENDIGISLIDVLYGKSAHPRIDETGFAQPAIFALQYALADLLQSWGIRPYAVMGHSVGEYAAACQAGVFSVEDGLRLIAARARLMQALPREGLMVAVAATPERVATTVAGLEEHVAIAAVNGPASVVVSGREQVLQSVVSRLEDQGLATKPLNVSHAFHSPLMDAITDDFRREASKITLAPPGLALVSNCTGELAERRHLPDRRRRDSSVERPIERRQRGPDRRQRDKTLGKVHEPEYWVRHVREPVLFSSGMGTLRGTGCNVFVEIGPAPVLLGLGRACLPDQAECLWLPTLRRGRDDWQQVLDSVAALYARGADVDWAGFDRDYVRRRVQLPGYPFQRRRYWIGRSGPAIAERRPWLMRRLVDSAVQVFETRLGPDAPSFLADHQVDDLVVAPATMYLELALAAASEVFGSLEKHLTDVVIQRALLLEEGVQRTVQVVLEPGSSNESFFRILSRAELSDPAWVQHATGKICLEAGETTSEPDATP